MYLEELVTIVKGFQVPLNPKRYYHASASTMFSIQSFQNSAVEELIRCIEESIFFENGLKNGKIDAITFMEKYRERMDDYACRAKTPITNVIFSIAYDLATDVLDEVIVKEYEK